MALEDRVKALEERVALMQARLSGLLQEDGKNICPACIKGSIKDKSCDICNGTGKKPKDT